MRVGTIHFTFHRSDTQTLWCIVLSVCIRLLFKRGKAINIYGRCTIVNPSIFVCIRNNDRNNGSIERETKESGKTIYLFFFFTFLQNENESIFPFQSVSYFCFISKDNYSFFFVKSQSELAWVVCNIEWNQYFCLILINKHISLKNIDNILHIICIYYPHTRLFFCLLWWSTAIRLECSAYNKRSSRGSKDLHIHRRTRTLNQKM